jgi:hypothetical protein
LKFCPRITNGEEAKIAKKRTKLWVTPLRDLKTTLGMETLRSQSPAMAEKELLAYLVAHNLIRGVMAEAVAQ